jgi:hypothetical protein
VSRLGYLQVTADLSGEKLVDLSVPWNGSDFPGFAIDVERVLAAFSEQFAPVGF